jgi:hypothetical protein
VHPTVGFTSRLPWLPTLARQSILASSHLGFALSTTHVCSGVVAIAVAAGVFLASRRNPVTAANVNDDTVVDPTLPATAGV